MTSLSGLRDRVALVTGAGDNIGRAVALAFAAAGTHVAVNVRENKRAADDVTREAIDRGVRAIAVVGDVSDPAADDAIVAQVRDALGPIDIFVHCVGVRPLYPIAETPIEEWRRVMDTNCSSYFYLARLVLPSMGERGCQPGQSYTRFDRGIQGGPHRSDEGGGRGVRRLWCHGEHRQPHDHRDDRVGTSRAREAA
jgi:NAD(P)-dependent dehydrogenase (short-subunit alcohol dehydrogenase family)